MRIPFLSSSDEYAPSETTYAPGIPYADVLNHLWVPNYIAQFSGGQPLVFVV